MGTGGKVPLILKLGGGEWPTSRPGGFNHEKKNLAVGIE